MTLRETPPHVTFRISLAPTTSSVILRRMLDQLPSTPALQRENCEIVQWDELDDLPFQRDTEFCGLWLILIDAHSKVDDLNVIFTCLDTANKTFMSNVCMLFVSDTYHTPVPHLDDKGIEHAETQKDEDKVDTLRLNQFYFRMVSSYGWGTFCYWVLVPQVIERSRIFRSSKSRQTAYSHSPFFFGLDAMSLRQWQSDLSRTWETLEKRLVRGLWVDDEKYGGDGKYLTRYFPQHSRKNLLPFMSLAHQIGRREQDKSRKTVKLFSKQMDDPRLRRQFDHTSIKSRNGEVELLARLTWDKFAGAYIKGETTLTFAQHISRNVNDADALLICADSRNRYRAESSVLTCLQDFAQNLAKGTAPWASEARKDLGRRIRILAVKDYVKHDGSREKLQMQFHSAFDAAFRRLKRADVEAKMAWEVKLHCLAPEKENGISFNRRWDTQEWWKHVLQGQERLQVIEDLSAGEEVISGYRLRDYDIILIETEYESRFIGPSIIHWLDHALRETHVASESNTGRKCRARIRPPHVFALSRDESAAHSFMSIALGADAYAPKSRVTGIPSLLAMSPIGRWAEAPDSHKLRPNFFALDGLLPRQRHQLRVRHPDRLIIGDEWDRHWIRSLPKADLHYHIGTSIRLSTISALAANTCGYLLTGQITRNQDDPRSILVRDCVRIAILTNLVYARYASQKIDAAETLWAIARFVLRPRSKSGKIVDRRSPEFGKLDGVIGWLTKEDRPIRQFESCAMLIMAFDLFSEFAKGIDDRPDEAYFANESDANTIVARQSSLYCDAWSSVGALGQLLLGQTATEEGFSGILAANTDFYFKRICRNWKDSTTRQAMEDAIKGKPAGDGIVSFAANAISNSKLAAYEIAVILCDHLSRSGRKWLGNLLEQFTDLQGDFVLEESEFKALAREFVDGPATAIKAAGLKSNHLSLGQIVKIPRISDSNKGEPRSLARYLVGASLLGADHLQYPEHLLLAAIDITKQNVDDNVIYSELRCATTGYCLGGMNVFDATDLLCLSFDLSSLFFGGWSKEDRDRAIADFASKYACESVEHGRANAAVHPWLDTPRRWVRMNILLGAKRNKPHEMDATINLVAHYLDRGAKHEPLERNRFGSEKFQPGIWWDRCAVSGFDLSGDESRQIENLRSHVVPLFRSSAPITIHAGEAMTAESIWDAVYQLGAQRIGHGIRLRDNQRLLLHCINRSICLELCPISNMFTNYFAEPPVSIEKLKTFKEMTRYPLVEFMEAGLDICINTDNRSLHHADTLTDDYLEAARVSGGLSRWDVLRICKAGFKHAFLPKAQLAKLLRHAEYEIYGLISDNSGENGFASFEYEVTRDELKATSQECSCEQKRT